MRAQRTEGLRTWQISGGVLGEKFQWEEGPESHVQGAAHRQDGGEGKCRLPL